MATRDGTRSSWSTRKKVKAEKGLWKRSPKDPTWRIRYTCGLGHLHKERVDTVKGNAEIRLAERRATVARDSAWCPIMEKQRARERALMDAAQERRRVTFKQYAADYLTVVRLKHRGWRSDESRVNGLVERFGDMMLDQVSSADVERFLDGLLKTRKPSTVNRWRILLQAMLNRAKRHGLLAVNPVRGVARRPEPEGRTLYLLPVDKAPDEQAIRAALRSDLRPLFTVSVHTGLRWSEQLALRWRDVDFFTGNITVSMSKSGRSRQVPMNSTVRSTLMDLAGQRQRPDDPEERVFRCPYRKADHAAIFVLIAGTFTPVHGLLFHGGLRWGPLILIWAAAITGITLKTIIQTLRSSSSDTVKSIRVAALLDKYEARTAGRRMR